MARLQAKNAGGSHHRFSRIIRHSPRDSFNGFLRALPRNRAFLLLSPAIISRAWPQRREARTTRLRRPQSHQSSAQALRADTTASIASRLTCRDDSAYAPLAEAGYADNAPDLGSESSEIPKIRTSLLRQIGTTGSLCMTRMRKLPVVPARGAYPMCVVVRILDRVRTMRRIEEAAMM
jgi:hypothetical protein